MISFNKIKNTGKCEKKQDELREGHSEFKTTFKLNVKNFTSIQN